LFVVSFTAYDVKIAKERIDEVLVKKAATTLSTGRRLAAARDDEQQIVEHSGIRA